MRDVRGAFNIAAEPVLTPRVIADTVGGRLVPLPPQLLRAAADVTFRLRLQPTEPGWIDMGVGVPMMDTSRARRELGWREEVSATTALAELFDGISQGAGTTTPPLHPRRRTTWSRALSSGARTPAP